MIGPEGFCEDVAAYQAADAVVDPDAAGLPGKLHRLPACAGDEIVLDQQVGGKQACNSADARAADFTAADHRIADDLIFSDGMVPALVADVNADSVGPVDYTVFNDPVMGPGSRRSSRAAGQAHRSPRERRRGP